MEHHCRESGATKWGIAQASLEGLIRRCFCLIAFFTLLLMACEMAFAGGPRWIAGSGYFDPAAKGQPVVWSGGKVVYYTDLGSLSSSVNQSKANSMIAAAVAVWNGVSTAAVSIKFGGSLAEDVSGLNVTADSSGAVTMPSDMQASATAKPVAIVYDTDGSVMDTIYGPGASSTTVCQNNGVITYIDNLAVSGNIAHAVMLVNGLCATNSNRIAVLQYQMVRGFGRILGLDWSETNEEMFVGDQITSEGITGWPIMHPVERLCTSNGSACLTNPTTLRLDDIAALNRTYPVTATNIGNFTGKTLTASVTLSVQGTIHFKRGQGMQGVNVVLRPLTKGSPDVRYTVTAVSGARFQGNAGSPVNGTIDAQGNPLDRFGSDDVSLEGFFDLSGVPLPAGVTSSDYQLSFESVNPEYVQEFSVGAYTAGQVSPSGTMPVITLRGLAAGSAVTQDVVIEDSADTLFSGNDGADVSPANIAASGEWAAAITGYGHSGWFQWWARANREFTVEAQALDKNGYATDTKAMPVIGVWNGIDTVGTSPVTGTLQPFNGSVVGLTTLPVLTTADSEVRLGIADYRGDGRPDFLYRGRILYADTVAPARLPASGGAILIRGTGFRLNSIVTVNGRTAQITSISPTEITAVAPDSGGITGNVLVEVRDPQTFGVAIIADGLSYNAQNGDGLSIVTAPSGIVNMGVPLAFTVKARDETARLPAAGVTVTFKVTGGTAVLDCGVSSCSAVTAADGIATMLVSANSTSLTQITAVLTNGTGVVAEFTGGYAPVLNAVTPDLYLALGATAQWTAQGLVLQNGTPAFGKVVTWISSGSKVVAPTTASISDSTGMVNASLAAGPLAAGDVVPVNACLYSTSNCAQFNIIGVHTETAVLTAVSGTAQAIPYTQTFVPVVLRVTDAVGHPMAGGAVTFYQTLVQWAPPCPMHGPCPASPVLEQQTSQAISATDGTVSLTPIGDAAQATRLYITAVTGQSGVLTFELDRNP